MDEIKILLIGDSHGTQILPHIEEYLINDGYAPENIDIVANNGWASYSYLDRQSDLNTYLAENIYDFVVVQLGGNNGYMNDTYGRKITQFLSFIGYPQSRIIWISPFHATHTSTQNRHVFTDQYLIENLPTDILYIPMMDRSKSYTLSSDGVHYKISQYKDMVDNDLYEPIKNHMLSQTQENLQPQPNQKKSPLFLFLLLGVGGFVFFNLRK